MSRLPECRAILGGDPSDESQATEIKGKALARIEVLATVAHRLCNRVATSPDGGSEGPAVTFDLVLGTDALFGGIGSVHRLLRQAAPESDAVMKTVAAIKKGPFSNVLNDVLTNVEYTDPVAWAVVPALRTAVDALAAMQELASS